MKRILMLMSGLILLASLSLSRAEEPKAAAYPLDTCVVSGEKLGEHGKPVEYEAKGRKVVLCCKMCKKDIDKDPDKYLKKLDEAEAAKKQ